MKIIIYSFLKIYLYLTLFHELAHLKLHIEKDKKQEFFDDLKSSADKIEQEADNFAQKQLIDEDAWNDFFNDDITKYDIYDFAEKLKISPAIVAGRVQFERKNYRVFRNILKYDSIREMFDVPF